MITVLILVLPSCISEYPSDGALLRRFERNEALLNDLVTQVQARPDIDILRRNVVFYEDGRREAPGEEADLRKMMRRLNLEVIAARGSGETSVYLELAPNPWSLTFDLVNATKGYAYLLNPPSPTRLVDNLQEVGNVHATHYKPIKSNWYLFLTIRD